MKNIIITSLLALAACAPLDDDFAFDRHGDTIDDATPITMGRWTGEVQDRFDQDYFVLNYDYVDTVRYRLRAYEEPVRFEFWVVEEDGQDWHFGAVNVLPGVDRYMDIDLGVDVSISGVMAYAPWDTENIQYEVYVQQVVGQ